MILIYGESRWNSHGARRLSGPKFFDGTITSQNYLQFLQEELNLYLENVPCDIRRNMIFQQDGAPPHNARIVAGYLNKYGNWQE